MDEKPKLAEPDASVESSKLPEGDVQPEGKSETKESPVEVLVPKTQADLGVSTNANTNVGSGDLSKP